MMSSPLLLLLSFALALASGSPHAPASTTARLRRKGDLPSEILQDHQDTLASSEPGSGRDLYVVDTIRPDCADCQPYDEEIIGASRSSHSVDDYTEYPTFSPTEITTWSPEGDDFYVRDDDERGDGQVTDNSVDRADSPATRETSHSTKSKSKSSKSKSSKSKSSKSSKTKSSKGSKSAKSSYSESSESRTGSSRDSRGGHQEGAGSRGVNEARGGHHEGADSGGLNKVSGMIEYTEAANSAPPVSVPGIFLATVVSAIRLLY